jgi:hypothetical protein
MTQSEIKLGLPFMAPNPIIERKPEKFNILWQIRVHNSRTEKIYVAKIICTDGKNGNTYPFTYVGCH